MNGSECSADGGEVVGSVVEVGGNNEYRIVIVVGKYILYTLLGICIVCSWVRGAINTA